MGIIVFSFIGMLIIVFGVNALVVMKNAKEEEVEVGQKDSVSMPSASISVYIKSNDNMLYCFDMPKDIKQQSLVIDSENKLYDECLSLFGTNEFVFDKTALYAVENDFREVALYKVRGDILKVL